MKHLLRRAFVSLIFLLHATAHGWAAGKGAIDWHPWSDDIFQQAQKQHRFVLLDLEAGWCHWCHVMDEITYGDPQVITLIKASYLPVKVDQDSRPDIANRYEDYGWPATVVFNPDGSEIAKRRGYLPPKVMASMLKAIIEDPSPGPSVVQEEPLEPSSTAGLTSQQRAKLEEVLRADYDPKNHGWGTTQKFLDWDIIEFCMAKTLAGDRAFERMARETLDAQLQLIDPVWGGVDQYSTDGDWQHPHYEKIMQFQAENLRIFTQAFALWHDPEYLEAAKKVRGFLRNFLTSGEGAFYTSQNDDVRNGEESTAYYQLDDAGRRKRGLPATDQHVYARENGWAINALATFYAATGDETALADALRAADWILAHRSLPGGGFRHDENDSGGPYLGDTVYMGRAFLKLYEVTADQRWLNRAEEAAQYAAKNFSAEPGYNSVGRSLGKQLPPKPQTDENVAFARLTNLLSHYLGDAEDHARAEHAMHYLAIPSVAARRGFLVGGILLADRECSSPPLHLTVVGNKSEPNAKELFRAALREPASYKRVEWFDPSGPPLPNSDVEFPKLNQAAAFVCTDRRCSLPIVAPEKIHAFVARSSVTSR